MPLLTTKLHAPPPRPSLVQRSRLPERLEEGLRPGQRLILIAGIFKFLACQSYAAPDSSFVSVFSDLEAIRGTLRKWYPTPYGDTLKRPSLVTAARPVS